MKPVSIADYPFKRVTPEFLHRLSWGKDTRWYITPSWLTNGNFVALRTRLPITYLDDIKTAARNLKEMLAPKTEVIVETDAFIQEKVWDRVAEHGQLVLKKRPVQCGVGKRKMSTWLFRNETSWALVAKHFVEGFQIKSLLAPKPLFNGTGTILHHNNLVICGILPDGFDWSSLKDMNASDFEYEYDQKQAERLRTWGPAEEELPLFNPPRRIIWKGVMKYAK